MDVVRKFSLLSIFIMFIVYLGIHIGIGIALKKAKEELNEKPGSPTLISNVKWLNIWFKWFPALYTIISVILFMM